jgi:hypothetical protein
MPSTRSIQWCDSCNLPDPGGSGDIAGSSPPSVFNVASSRLDFVPGRPLPIVPRPSPGSHCVDYCPWTRVEPSRLPIGLLKTSIQVGYFHFGARPTFASLQHVMGRASDCAAAPGGYAFATWRNGVAAWLRPRGSGGACGSPRSASVTSIRLTGSTWKTRPGLQIGSSVNVLKQLYPRWSVVRAVPGRHGRGYELAHGTPALFAETGGGRVTALVVVTGAP